LVAYDERATALPGWLSTFTATGERLTSTDTTFTLYRRTYAAGAAINLGGNQHAPASGAGSQYWVIVRGNAPVSLFSASINFQPAASPTVSGFAVDSGLAYGNRGANGVYGWNLANDTTRDRNSSAAPDQRHDTLIHLQKLSGLRWEIAVPNGTYDVTLLCGDPSFTDQVNHLLVEGVTVSDSDGQDRFDEVTVRVTVNDGRLTIQPASNAQNAKLCSIELIAVPGAGG
jgi:hypothetical protein